MTMPLHLAVIQPFEAPNREPFQVTAAYKPVTNDFC